MKDQEFEKLDKEIKNASQMRLKSLAAYNKECEESSMQTKKSETMLKEKDSERLTVQLKKEGLEKQLSDLSELHLKEQTTNYNLSHQHKFLKQKSEQTESRINMLQEKIQFMTDSLSKQIKEQAENANELDVKF